VHNEGITLNIVTVLSHGVRWTLSYAL